MKTFTFVLAITIFAALGFTKQAFASDVQNAFQISNQQAEALGQVTVTTPDGNYYANVGGNMTVPVQIFGTANTVTINNQIVPQGIQMNISLQDGKVVQVIWTSSNSIAVLDPAEMQ